MNTVKRKNIPRLHRTDPGFFARWLIGGLKTLHTTGRGFTGFRGAAAFVGATADTSEDLRDIHNCLNPDEQVAFRAGIARALSRTVHLLTDPRAIGICNTLLILAQRLEADDVLDVLPGFASHVFRLARTDEIDEMMDRVLLTASEVVTPGSQSGDCLRTIISFGRFRSDLAYSALIGLCKAEPGKLGDHLGRLYHSLDDAFGYVENWDELMRREVERRDLIAEVFDIVPNDEFFRSTADVPRFSRQSGGSAKWLVFADWWRDDCFLVPGVADKYAELLSDGEFSLGKDRVRVTSDEMEMAMTVGHYEGSMRTRIGIRAAEARQAMPGIDLMPESVEEADDTGVVEAA
jgi:hypothetical protein